MVKISLKNILFFCFLLIHSISHAENQYNDYLKPNINDIVLGSENAEITLIEYSSLSCPHCAYFHRNIFDKIKKKYIDSGKLKYIHRSYPLDKADFAGSVLARCAGKEKYYIFLNVLFEKQENWISQKNYIEILENIGKLGGLSSEKFNHCQNDKDLEKLILESRMIATNKLNVKGTPSFFVNGKSYVGSRDLKFFDEIFSNILKNNK